MRSDLLCSGELLSPASAPAEKHLQLLEDAKHLPSVVSVRL